MANEELISSIPAGKRRWQRLVLHFIAIYLGIGFSISFLENLWRQLQVGYPHLYGLVH